MLRRILLHSERHEQPRNDDLSRTGRSFSGRCVPRLILSGCASAAASSAYLTVSETFPLEVRALAIAFFYAIGTGIGGVAGPWVFGALIDTGSRWSVFGGYLFGSVSRSAPGRWTSSPIRQNLSFQYTQL